MTIGRLLWQLIRYRPGVYLAAALAWTFFLLVTLVPGLIVRQMFDVLAARTEAPLAVIGLLAVFVAVSLARVGSTYWAVNWDVTFQHTVGALIRRNVFARVLSRRGAEALPESPGEMLSRFRDDVDHVMRVLSDAPYVISQAVFAALAIGIMVQIHWRLTLFVVPLLMGVLLVVDRAGYRLERYRRASREAAGRVTDFLAEMLSAVLAVKVADAEEAVVRRFAALNDRRRRAAVKDRFFAELINSVSTNTVHLGTGLVLLLAAGDMRAGRFSVGDFSLFAYYLYFVTGLPVWLGRFLTQYRQTQVSFQRLTALTPAGSPMAVVAHGPSLEDGWAPHRSYSSRSADDRLDRLEVRNLTCCYSSGRGVERVSLTVPRGSFTVITGPMGSGKTTLLRAVLGLLPEQEGEVYWNGQRVTNPSAFFVPPRAAYTPQVPHLFTDTLRDNILLGLPEDSVELAGALYSAVLERDLADMPEGMDTMVGARGIRLSGGQVQRAAAARLFVREPELLVFDDLSSALDIETERLLWERLDRQRDVTCLVVSHRPTALRRATHIVVLEDGKVQGQGSLDQLLASNTYIRRLWNGLADLDGATRETYTGGPDPAGRSDGEGEPSR